MSPTHPIPGAETDDGEAGPVAVELSVRSVCPRAERPPQDATIDRLERLEREGGLDGYTVHACGKRVSPEGTAAETAAGRFVLSRIEAFRDWADRNGAPVRSFFDTYEVDSAITGEVYTAITDPSLTLAEFHGDDPLRVTPRTRDGAAPTSDDHLDAPASGSDGGGR